MKTFNLTFAILFTLLTMSFSACKKKPKNLPKAFDCTTGLTSSTTLKKGTYEIDCSITIGNNAILTISPGVVLEFSGDGELITQNGGSIKAEGTSSDPIVFKGLEDIKGYWYGIDIHTNSLNNSFKYCQFSYGGKGTRSMVRVGDGSTSNSGTAVFQNCTFSNGLKNGLYCAGNSSIAGSVNNIFTGNTEYPVSVELGSVSTLSGTNTYSGNGKDYVNVSNDYQFSGNATFNKLDVPYYLLATVNDIFELSGNIMVKPGAILVMGPNMDLEVENTGSFNCIGTSSERITIRGFEAVKGYWDKIRFRNSSSSLNHIEYTDIKDGGREDSQTWGDIGILACCECGTGGGNNITVMNCTISNSLNWGIYFTHCNGVDGTIINGMTGAANVQSSLQSNNSFSNNTLGDVFTSD